MRDRAEGCTSLPCPVLMSLARINPKKSDPGTFSIHLVLENNIGYFVDLDPRKFSLRVYVHAYTSGTVKGNIINDFKIIWKLYPSIWGRRSPPCLCRTQVLLPCESDHRRIATFTRLSLDQTIRFPPFIAQHERSEPSLRRSRSQNSQTNTYEVLAEVQGVLSHAPIVGTNWFWSKETGTMFTALSSWRRGN